MDSGPAAAAVVGLFLKKVVPLDDLLVDVGRHAVPVFEFFAAREHERSEHHATNHAICIIIIIIIITSAVYSGWF